MDKARAEFARRAEQERLQAEKAATEERAEAEKLAAEERVASASAALQASYDSCVSVARSTYNNNWALGCKQLAEKAKKAHADCLVSSAQPTQGYCDKVYPQSDPSPNCALPRYISADLN